MSEDVNTTPEGDHTQHAGTTPEGDGLPPELEWVKTATPQQLAEAIQKLQEKSTTRLDDLTAKEAELARLRAEKQQAEDAKLAEQQKWQELAEQRQARIAELENKAKDSDLDKAVMQAANDLKFHSWQEAKKLADLSGVDTSTTDGGASAVKTALQQLADQSPHLVKSEDTTTAQQQGARVINPAGKVSLTAADLEKMTPQAVLKLMQDDPGAVDAALQNPK